MVPKYTAPYTENNVSIASQTSSNTLTSEYISNKVFRKDNIYFIPVRSKMILKKVKNLDMMSASAEVAFTQLIWINLVDAPEEIQKRLGGEVPINMRINQEATNGLSQDNCNIREKKGIVTITYRDQVSLPLIAAGDLKWAPFCRYKLEYSFELSHFNIEVKGEKCQVRFNFHENVNSLEEMIGFRVED